MDPLVSKNKIMKQDLIHNLIWFPIFLIGLISVCLGIAWLLHPEPWMLDKTPNEALLQTTFDNLFSLEVNSFLPLYLKTIYRFFGLWMITIGLIIWSYVNVTRLGTSNSRNSLYYILSTTLFGLYFLVFSYLPTSPFIPVLYGLTILLVCSVYFSIQLKE